MNKFLAIFFSFLFVLTQSNNQDNNQNVSKIAFLEIKGPLYDTRDILINLLKVGKDDTIKGIILLVNSPGGSASNSSAVHDLILSIKKYKPILAVVTGQALSAGYLIASATNYIIAPYMADIGSIGVVLSFQKYKNPKINGEISADLEPVIVSAGKHKVVTNPFTKISEEDITELKKDLKKSYEYFCRQVAENRHLDLKKISEWADAKIFSGEEALKQKLIDEVGSLARAEDIMINLLKQYYRSEGTSKIERIFIETKESEKPKQQTPLL